MWYLPAMVFGGLYIKRFGWLAILFLVVRCGHSDVAVGPVKGQSAAEVFATNFTERWCADVSNPRSSILNRLLDQASGNTCLEKAQYIYGQSILDLTSTVPAATVGLADLRPLMGLANLQTLFLDGHRIESLSQLEPLRDLHSLRTLFLQRTNLTSLFGIGRYIPNVKYLNVSHNRVAVTRGRITTDDDDGAALEQLVVEDCGLLRVPEFLPKNIRVLRLGGNNLQRAFPIGAGVANQTAKLELIDFSGCFLAYDLELAKIHVGELKRRFPALRVESSFSREVGP